MLKRIAGGLAMLFGTIGLVACLVGCAGVWTVCGRLDDIVTQSFRRVDTSLERLKARAQQVNKLIDEAQESVVALNDRVQQRVADRQDIPPDEAAGIDEIERQLRARIRQARDWIGFMQAAMDLVEQVLEMTESTSAFLQDDSRTTQDLAAALRAGYNEIDQATQLFDQVGDAVAELRESQNVEANAKRIETISAKIHAALGIAERYGGQFETGVSGVRTDVAELSNEIRWRITLLGWIITCLVLWIAAGQFCLALYGWRLARKPAISDARS
jgi:chromosome segregation ATPase